MTHGYVHTYLDKQQFLFHAWVIFNTDHKSGHFLLTLEGVAKEVPLIYVHSKYTVCTYTYFHVCLAN